MSDPKLTTGDVARFCGVNARTVVRWIKKGFLPAYQLPGRGDHRVPLEDFLAFLSEHRIPVPEELRDDGVPDRRARISKVPALSGSREGAQP